MSARAATVFRGIAWVLVAAVVASDLPVVGFILGGAAIAFALWAASHGKSSVWATPLLWAGTAAMILATVYSYRAGSLL